MAALFKEIIAKLVEKNSLTDQEAYEAMIQMMQGEATESQIAAYLTALRMKGETVEEISGSARAMREKAIRLRPEAETVVDTCGTGGDRKGTFNISTVAAFVLAGAGVTVAKHGNRSVSSSCGSADVLKQVGVNIELDPLKVESMINRHGIGFLFAPSFHRSMRFARKTREEIGFRSLFNILGPLTNPALAAIQVLGVYRPELTELMARVLVGLGSRHCFVVHGSDGLDEITLTGPTRISEGKDGKIHNYTVVPEDFGLERCLLSDFAGGTPEENAGILIDILNGEKGPRRNIVLVNAAPALIAANKAGDFKSAIAVASESIDSGRALGKLKEVIDASHKG